MQLSFAYLSCFLFLWLFFPFTVVPGGGGLLFLFAIVFCDLLSWFTFCHCVFSLWLWLALQGHRRGAPSPTLPVGPPCGRLWDDGIWWVILSIFSDSTDLQNGNSHKSYWHQVFCRIVQRVELHMHVARTAELMYLYFRTRIYQSPLIPVPRN